MNSSNNRPNRCSCGKSFKTVSSLDQHRRDAPIHTGSSNTAANPPPLPQLAMPMTSIETTGAEAATSETGAVTVVTSDGGMTQSETGRKKNKKKTKGEDKKQEQAKFNRTTSSDSYPSDYLYHPFSTPQYKYNPNTCNMMDMWQDQDWSLCDKDCGWCGHCYD
ncbi:hypothetical protein MMC07_004477 [Pseudocyphellaria aurata]|nr:hypothetical protein [Pseudocyphellaria aurata]